MVEEEEDKGEFRNREKDEEEEEEGERSFIGTFLRRRSVLEASAGASAVLGFDTTGMKELRAEKTAARGRWFL